MTQEQALSFQAEVYSIYRMHGRDLVWRRTKDPYQILVSEIMLQQTQVSRVVEKYATFLAAFPTIEALACATQRDVVALWSGLGYNRRALALHKCAQEVVARYDGMLPSERLLLQELPGIGPYTAGAICAFAFSAACGVY